jgi:phosphoketolase
MSHYLADSSSALKALETRLSENRKEQVVRKQEQASACRRLTDLGNQEKSILADLERLRPVIDAGPPVVSEHALLRYLERIEGLDLDAVRARILGADENMSRALATLGNGTYPVADSHRVKVINRVVITVLPV